MTSRGYDASGRREQARATRARILGTARELFIADGYAATSMARIARAAGVSTPTVFAAFTAKANLLKEAAETTLVGDADPVPLAERPQMRRVYEAPSAAEVVSRLADFVVEAAPRAYPIFAVVFAAADADPQIAAVARTIDDQRLVGAGYLADALARHLDDGAQRRDELRDVLWAATSLHLYGQLVVQRGWSVRRYGDWVAHLVGASLTTPVSAGASRPSPSP
ncbi:MAG TPA: helix-turn-helix domain-containing protein [Pseudonocardia sp.]|nr:helix-turn-helix domain-containing protein [Pseudonocardia sp.]